MFYDKIFHSSRSNNAVCIVYERDVPWLRWLVADILQRTPGFTLGAVHVRFVVEIVALGQVSSVFPVSITPPWLPIIIYHQASWWL
jgi:hypothetical protein